MRSPGSGAFSDDIAIDLGTANTLVHVVGRGIIIDEPSVVVAAGAWRPSARCWPSGCRAKAMHGRTPEPVELIRPMRDGVIADFIATEEMLRQFIARAKTMLGFRRPRILICVPAGATPVERRAVYETAMSAGARTRLSDRGAGGGFAGRRAAHRRASRRSWWSTSAAAPPTSPCSAGQRGAGALAAGRRQRHGRGHHALRAAPARLVIGEANAERIKIEAGTALAQPNGRQVEIHIKGRDLREGRLKTVVLGPRDMAEALSRAGRRDGRVHPARARGPAARRSPTT